MKSDDDESGSSAVVDFDALNAALGALPPTPTSSANVSSDSEGRSSATYASARPHAPPSTRAPLVDPNTPAVIVAPDDAVETPPVTAPFVPNPKLMSTLPMMNAPQPPTSPRSFAPMAPQPPLASPAPPQTQTQPLAEPVTVPLGRPVARPRKGATSTVVVHRGPTGGQKVLVFLAMLIVVVAGGVSAVLYYEPAAFSFLRPVANRPGVTTVANAGNGTASPAAPASSGQPASSASGAPRKARFSH